MKSKIIVLAVASALATSAWAGPKSKPIKEESIGLGSGAAIGAIAGGPVGLMLGAAFGGWLGDRFHHERAERAAADERYQEADAKAASLATRLTASERAVEEKSAALFNERLAHRADLEQALSVEVFFRTEDSTLGGDTEQRLAKLATLIEPMDGAVVRLEGHADARGTEDFNSALSSARAEAVREALVRAGISAERIVVAAAGETQATAPEQDPEGMALERRVELSVVDLDDARRVARQDTP